ncbi:hypothetical protein [Clostridium hydrogenum]|uniref:hypothetical protein n=1 Tax=Clostridium hydrogenum TaxID=2855764 RepID=UPI001F221BDC|nr:hypothetical protein [Clostridium hydrogenum]
MKNLIGSELYRMLHSTKTIALFIITMLIFAADSMFIQTYHFGFYDPKHSIALNALNFSPFILRDTDYFMFIISCPIMFCDSLNYENTCGAYRLVMMRGYHKSKYILSKIISCAILFFILTIFMFFLGAALGFAYESPIKTTTFFSGQHFNSLQALIYDFKFYLINYLLILMLLGICSLISVLSPQVIISYIIVCLIWVMLSPLSNLFLSSFNLDIFDTKTAFDVLDGKNAAFWIIALFMTIGLFALSSSIFKKKDYLY